jgi:hypothetical protein
MTLLVFQRKREASLKTYFPKKVRWKRSAKMQDSLENRMPSDYLIGSQPYWPTAEDQRPADPPNLKNGHLPHYPPSVEVMCSRRQS